MSSRPKRSVSADLAAANAALDVCAALFRAQGDADPISRPPAAEPVPDAKTQLDRGRLAELEIAVSSVTKTYAGQGRSGAAAAAIAANASKVIAEAWAALASVGVHSPAALKPPVQRDRATQRALRAAIDRYFSYFEVPGTTWRLEWRLFTDSGLPSATAYGSSPGDIEGSYAIALPEHGAWRTATKLVALEPAPSKAIAVITAGTKLTPLSKYYLAGLNWGGGAGSLILSRSKKKLSSALCVSYAGDGTVTVCQVDAAGTALGAPSAIDGATTTYLDALWWKLSAAAMGLVHGRGDAISLTHEGAPVETLADPARMAEAIMLANTTLLEKVDAEVDDEMRAKLSSKFNDVPRRYRLDGLILAVGSNPPDLVRPSFAESAIPELAPTKRVRAETKPGRISQNVIAREASATDVGPPTQSSEAETKVARAPIAPTGRETSRVATPLPPADEPLPPADEPLPPADEPLALKPVAKAKSGPISKFGPLPARAVMARIGGLPASALKPGSVMSRPGDAGPALFGQHTIDEKFAGLDLEVDVELDWDEEPARTEDATDPKNDTLPGVTPPVPHASNVTIRRPSS